MNISQTTKRVSPAQIIVMGFAGIIVLGAILLNLPIASSSGRSIGLLDAFFTSASGVCVTGLSVIEVGTELSVFGQVVLLILIQIGGLGFMITTSFIYMVIGKRITLKERMVLKESLNEFNLQGIVRMARNILLLTLVAESAGILLMMIRFVPDYGVAQGIYYSVFHSISSFCNAGFDILGFGNSMQAYVGDPLINFTMMGLVITGGIGFFVLLELFRAPTRSNKHKFSTHTKIVLITTATLIGAGFVVFFVTEYSNPNTLGNLPLGNKVMAALFQSVTTRTAGFSTIGQGGLLPVSKLMTLFLMFIGASPAGTGGGIKTTTFAVVIMLIASIIRGHDEITVFKRRINKQVAMRGIAIMFLGLAFIGILTIALSLAETGNFKVGDLLFQLTSAFGTVGLSTIQTGALSAASDIVLMIAMFTGRVGLLTITFAIAKRLANKTQNKMKYPEDKIMIG
jgi:trk system potassium uptake protein TrkH